VLVIKAPDTDGDGDSLASMTSELEDRQATEGLGLGLSTNDLEDEPLGDMEGVEAPETDLMKAQDTESASMEEAEEITTLPPASERKPSSHRLPTPIITSSPILPNTPGGIVSPASSSTSSISRKIRSRQSLIPTPSSSRKHSPSERAYKDVGRRTSMGDLLSRASEHMGEKEE